MTPTPPLQNHDDMTGREMGGAREKKGPRQWNKVLSFVPQVDVVDVVIIDVIKKESIIYVYILQIKRRCRMSVVETTFEPWHLPRLGNHLLIVVIFDTISSPPCLLELAQTAIWRPMNASLRMWMKQPISARRRKKLRIKRVGKRRNCQKAKLKGTVISVFKCFNANLYSSSGN